MSIAYSSFNLKECPQCGSLEVSVSVKTRAIFFNGSPDPDVSFDDPDRVFEPIIGDDAVCQECEHAWPIALKREPASNREVMRKTSASSSSNGA